MVLGGPGKTSSARILAKALNCTDAQDGEPCGVCASCVEITQGTSLNVHELDAASNNGVDAMRDLVAHAGLGTPGRWKIYIVDEVHMLSNAAANALLKTLEEPPSHVVFVLATTDPQKVPPTIRSRTQHLEFRLIGADTLHELLQSVREKAGLDIGEDSVEAAVRRGRGSARDALSALDQVAASGSADSARPEVAPVLRALADGEASDLLVALSGLLAGGWGPQPLATELVDELRQVFLAALGPGTLCGLGRRSSRPTRPWLKQWDCPGWCAAWRSWVRPSSTCGTHPMRRWCLRLPWSESTQPDLDSGIAALTERVAALERGVPAGAPACSGSGRPAAPVPAHVPPSHRASRGPYGPVGTGVGSRPSLGAVQRRQGQRGGSGRSRAIVGSRTSCPMTTAAQGGADRSRAPA